MKYLAIAAALLVPACADTASSPGSISPTTDAAALTCPVHTPSDIAIWINAMPGPNDNPTLIAQFKVTAPTPGYTFDLKVAQVRESAPPQYVFDLISTPPDGMVTQVETITDVRVDLPNFDYSEIRSATVNCDGKALFSVADVETVH